MKRILLVGALLLSANAIFAQRFEVVEEAPKRIDINRLRFGAYFGPNISWMKPTANKSSDGLYRVKSGGSKVGFTWGLMADYFFADNYGLSTGFQVNTTGGKIETNRIGTDSLPNTVYMADFDYSIQYLELPFQLKLLSDPLVESRLRVFGQIGLTAGINIGKKASYEVLYTDELGSLKTTQEEKEKLYGTTSVAPVTLQLNVGAGIQRPITDKLSFYFGLFFNNGFAPDATNPKEYDLNYKGSFSDGTIRLNSFVFRLGIFF